jgi:cellulose synthase/poly-beta-1,6-N-acetylglucosamine synthase-like glycosyltransferase
MKHLRIVTPIFNDWPAFLMLLRDLDQVCAKLDCGVSVLAIDDGSTDDMPVDPFQGGPLFRLREVEVVKLAVNLGHQRAIAVGVSMAARDPDVDAILIMDGDGEDRPQDIPHLLAAAAGQPDFVVVAQRRHRTESFSFRVFYMLYKLAFALLTGRRISFGNFSLISRDYARRLTMVPELWNNLPAALLRCRLPIQRLPIDRGHRYAGTSKMNYVALMVHGLSAISVYSDAIFIRMLIATGILFVVSCFVIATVISMRLFFPGMATPGWATTVVLGTMIILFQALVSTVAAALLLLNNRNQRLMTPALDYDQYVLSRTELRLHPMRGGVDAA